MTWQTNLNPSRVFTAITVAALLGFRFYSIYKSSQQTKRSPKVRSVERIIAVSLWSFIAVGVILILLTRK